MDKFPDNLIMPKTGSKNLVVNIEDKLFAQRKNIKIIDFINSQYFG